VVELTRHFLATMFEGEGSSARGQWTTVAVGLLACALPAGMLLLRAGSPMPEYSGKYRILSKLPNPDAFRATALADELALLLVLAAVTVMATLFVWQSLFPSRRDYLALAGLPIRPSQIFGARFAAVCIFAAGLTVALNLLPTFTAPFEFAGKWQKSQSFWVNLNAQAAASGLECLFLFFAIVALQGILLNALPPRFFVRVSGYVQGALFAVFAFGILRSWSIKDWSPETVARVPEFGAWAPPVWFAGLHEYLLGDRDPFLSGMAARALTALFVSVGLSVITYCLSYRRYQRLLLEGSERVARPQRFGSIFAVIGRDPRQRALTTFMASTMARSRTHRMIWLAYIGLALAIVFNSSLVNGAFLVHDRKPFMSAVQFAVLFWPLACSAILVPGIKHVIRIPAELPANWIFKVTEGLGRREWMKAVDRFLLIYALGPLYAFIVPVAVYSLGWAIALRMIALQFVTSLTVFEAAFYSWQQLPFACSYRPGQRSTVNVILNYLAVLGILVPMISVIIAAASRFWPLFAMYGAGFLAGWLKLRRMRHEGCEEAPLLYEDSAAIVPDLGIREINSRRPSSDSPWPPPLPHPAPSSEPAR
jgi:hypothetical protein